ncbi:MAG: nucleotide exchange factor GrpE [Maricaulaceae bacterium]|nr:nucleotide exchange factor GrpE [Maricaulaceae bacterium]
MSKDKTSDAETATQEIESPQDVAREGSQTATSSDNDETGKSAEQWQAELDDLRDRLLRAVADVQNTRKRAEREVKDARDYAVSGFARDLLAVADNFSRALDAAKGAALDGPAKALLDGVAMTERSLLSAFERHGIKKLDPAPGDAFDPHLHQAAAQIPSDQPEGSIAAVMTPGYVIGERTLRAAMVAVSSGAPAQAADGGATAPAAKKTNGAGGDGPAKPPGGSIDVKA